MENFPGKEQFFEVFVSREGFRGVIEQLGLGAVFGCRTLLCPFKTAPYSFMHFGCRLVREGQRQNLLGMVYQSQEAKKPGGEQKGFARTGGGRQVKAPCRIQSPVAFFSICQKDHL